MKIPNRVDNNFLFCQFQIPQFEFTVSHEYPAFCLRYTSRCIKHAAHPHNEKGGVTVRGTIGAPQDQVATIDLSKNLVGGVKLGSAVLFTQGNNNAMKPGVDKNDYFNLSENITAIELIPIRFEVIENRKRMITCTNAKVVEEVDCSVASIPCVLTCDSSSMCGDSDGCLGLCDGACVNAEDVCLAGVCVENLCGNGDVDGEEECDSVVGCSDECVALLDYSCEPSINECYPQ